MSGGTAARPRGSRHFVTLIFVEVNKWRLIYLFFDFASFVLKCLVIGKAPSSFEARPVPADTPRGKAIYFLNAWHGIYLCLSSEKCVEATTGVAIEGLMANRLYQVVRSLLEANRSPAMKALDLRSSPDLQCVNMMCEKVGEACVCRLSRVLEKNGQELRSLCLADNKLSQLPAIVFELPHLQVLDLSGNALEEIPEAVVNLKSLKVLDVTGNPIKRVPKAVAKQLYGLVEIRRDDAK